MEPAVPAIIILAVIVIPVMYLVTRIRARTSGAPVSSAPESPSVDATTEALAEHTGRPPTECRHLSNALLGRGTQDGVDAVADHVHRTGCPACLSALVYVHMDYPGFTGPAVVHAANNAVFWRPQWASAYADTVDADTWEPRPRIGTVALDPLGEGAADVGRLRAMTFLARVIAHDGVAPDVRDAAVVMLRRRRLEVGDTSEWTYFDTMVRPDLPADVAGDQFPIGDADTVRSHDEDRTREEEARRGRERQRRLTEPENFLDEVLAGRKQTDDVVALRRPVEPPGTGAHPYQHLIAGGGPLAPYARIARGVLHQTGEQFTAAERDFEEVAGSGDATAAGTASLYLAQLRNGLPDRFTEVEEPLLRALGTGVPMVTPFARSMLAEHYRRFPPVARRP